MDDALAGTQRAQQAGPSLPGTATPTCTQLRYLATTKPMTGLAHATGISGLLIETHPEEDPGSQSRPTKKPISTRAPT